MEGKKKTTETKGMTESDYDRIILTVMEVFQIELNHGEAVVLCLEKESDLDTWKKLADPAQRHPKTMPKVKSNRMPNTSISDRFFTESDRGACAHVVLAAFTTPDCKEFNELYHRNIELFKIHGRVAMMNLCK